MQGWGILMRSRNPAQRVSEDVSKAPKPIKTRHDPIGGAAKKSDTATAAFIQRNGISGRISNTTLRRAQFNVSAGTEFTYLMPIANINIAPPTAGVINGHRKPYQTEF